MRDGNNHTALGVAARSNHTNIARRLLGLWPLTEEPLLQAVFLDEGDLVSTLIQDDVHGF